MVYLNKDIYPRVSYIGSFISIFSAYNLADAGFDVWLGNARGNVHSRYHNTLDPDHDEQKYEFFDFSWEEIGTQDLPAMIDYILEYTGRDKLHYIGHSQGGTVFLVLNSLRPEYNQKIESAHLLAGVGYMEHFPDEQLVELAIMVDLIYVSYLFSLVILFGQISLREFKFSGYLRIGGNV